MQRKCCALAYMALAVGGMYWRQEELAFSCIHASYKVESTGGMVV